MRRLARPMLYLGTAAAVVGLGKVHAVLHGYDYTASSRFAWSFAYVGVLGLAAYGLGLPDLPRRRSAVLTASAAAGSGALSISAVQLVAGDALLPRFVVFGAAAILVPWFVLTSRVASDADARARERDRVLLVGGPVDEEILRDELDEAPERPAQLVAVVGLAAARPRRPGEEPLVDRAIDADVTVVVLGRAAQEDPGVVAQAAVLHESGVRVRSVSRFYEEWLGKLPVAELERVSLMFDISELHGATYARLKRLLDVGAGLAGGVALVVCLPFVVAGDLVANRGPLLYRQRRVGRDGRRFEILKFRTMRPAGPGGSEWTAADDPRVTPFGRFLRRTHLDELPQVVNVLRGDLSIVGPRPEQPQYVEELEEKIPYYRLRHLVRPGLTGWAQVKFHYGGCTEDATEKLQYEFWYLRHQSLALDLRIMGRTIRSVLGRGGR
ncbi:MAG: sugar transferase [Acidimicrobiia bacterium]|nr:sugar transferase [Acidimicrobiia bacterium]